MAGKRPKVKNMPPRQRRAVMANIGKSGSTNHQTPRTRYRGRGNTPHALTFEEFKALRTKGKCLSKRSNIATFPAEKYEKLEPSGTYFEDESAPELVNFEEETELTWATDDLERAIDAGIYNIDVEGQKQVHVYTVNPDNYKKEEDGFASDKPETINGHLIIERKGGADIEFDHSFSWDYFKIINPDEAKRLEKIPHLYHGSPIDLRKN